MSKPSFLLVHGAWHGAWCWHKIVAQLENAGHAVFAPELKRRTLAAWTDAVCGILTARPEPMILVGHSRGGIVISQAAERLPDKVKRLVYVSGFLLRQGESVLRILRENGESPLLQHAVLSPDKAQWTLEATQTRSMFYNMCSSSDVEFAQSRLTPEPAAPLMTPLKITGENFGRLPRIYIECLRDRAVPLSLQRRMHQALPCQEVRAIDTDHSPFFSAPDELAAHLMR